MSNENSFEAGDLVMRFDLKVLQHLGLQMYTSLPPAISEYVANAWDALARNVDITIPKEPMSSDYEITITDDGKGMTKQDLNNKFLVIGRDRRSAEERDRVSDDEVNRKLMGRKGIGKLAGFGVADVVQVETRRNGHFVKFELDYGEMKREAEKSDNATTSYNPKIIDEGETNEPSGTTVKLRELDRTQRPNSKYIRQRIARRFSVIGDKFTVQVNGDEVTGQERNLKERCQFLREYDDEPISDNENYVIDEGWIGTLPKPVPDEVQGGVAVMARGKTAQKPITFGVDEGGAHGQAALQYLVGEIHADFLDDEEDLIATHRSEVMWERGPAESLYDFVAEEIRDFISEWPDRRATEEMQDMKETDPYERYIEPLGDKERDLADNFLSDLAKRGGYDEDMVEDMASYVSSGVQQKAFSDLLKDIEKSDIENTEKLVELFDHYEVLDAMNSLRIVKGRMRAIQKFEELIKNQQGGIGNLHAFISDNPWLIDPRWDYLDEEISITKQLKENFDTQATDRVGFICLGGGDTIRLIDIRSPDCILTENDLREFENYVDYLRSLQGMDPIKDRDIEGYIVAQGTRDNRNVQSELRRMRMDDMRIRTYGDIEDIARRSHHEFIQVFERKAERTGSEMLKSHMEPPLQTDLEDFSLT